MNWLHISQLTIGLHIIKQWFIYNNKMLINIIK